MQVHILTATHGDAFCSLAVNWSHSLLHALANNGVLGVGGHAVPDGRLEPPVSNDVLALLHCELLQSSSDLFYMYMKNMWSSYTLHTCIHAYIHIYIHTYIHTYIHIHTRNMLTVPK